MCQPGRVSLLPMEWVDRSTLEMALVRVGFGAVFFAPKSRFMLAAVVVCYEGGLMWRWFGGER